jgi:transcriptional/translational regulatory protein YebC/TACO1
MGGSLGETGSVSFMFDRIGLVQFKSEVASNDEFFEVAIDCGANDILSGSDGHYAVTDPDNFINLRDGLIAKFGNALTAKIDWQAKNHIEIDLEQAKTILKMIDLLEDCDDVQNVVGNYLISEDILTKIESSF